MSVSKSISSPKIAATRANSDVQIEMRRHTMPLTHCQLHSGISVSKYS